MSPVATWGTLVIEPDVDDAVVALLRKWLPTYIRRLEVERGITTGTIARPRANSFDVVFEDDGFPDHRLPAVLVTTAEASEPEIAGDGQVSAQFSCAVTVIYRGRTLREARAVAAQVGGCVRRLMMDQQRLDALGPAEIRWLGSKRASVEDVSGEGRHLAGHLNTFRIYVDDVLTAYSGPSDPLVPGPYPVPDPEPNPDQQYDPPQSVDTVVVQVDGTTPSHTVGS